MINKLQIDALPTKPQNIDMDKVPISPINNQGNLYNSLDLKDDIGELFFENGTNMDIKYQNGSGHKTPRGNFYEQYGADLLFDDEMLSRAPTTRTLYQQLQLRGSPMLSGKDHNTKNVDRTTNRLVTPIKNQGADDLDFITKKMKGRLLMNLFETKRYKPVSLRRAFMRWYLKTDDRFCKELLHKFCIRGKLQSQIALWRFGLLDMHRQKRELVKHKKFENLIRKMDK